MVETVDFITALDPNMTLQTWQALLLICIEDVSSVAELKERLQVSMSTASRIVAYLSDTGSRGKTGLGLIETATDPLDRRRLVLRVSETGDKLIETVLEGIGRGYELLNDPSRQLPNTS